MIALLLASAGAAGCASNPAPPAWRLSVEQAQRTPYGAWAVVETASGKVAGELLALAPDAIHLDASGLLVRIPMSTVREVELGVHQAPMSGVTSWVVLGTLSTGSHGLLAILTAPLLWIVPGIFVLRVQSTHGIHSEDADSRADLLELRRFARFPAGLPPGFRLAPRAPR